MELGRMVGLWLAEGDRQTTREITFTNNMTELVRLFHATLWKYFSPRNRPRMAVYLPRRDMNFVKPIDDANYRVYVDSRASRPYYIYRVSGVELVVQWRRFVKSVCKNIEAYQWILQGFFAGEGNVKYDRLQKSRVLRIAQGARHPLLEKILRHFGIPFRYGGHRVYVISGRANLEKLDLLGIASLHPLKQRSFVEMMGSYRQRHYPRGTLPKLIYQNLDSPRTTADLSAQLKRSSSRISHLLSMFLSSGRVKMYRVHSTYYWVRSGAQIVVISPEKKLVIEHLKVPMRVSELSRLLVRAPRSVKNRLLELERMGLVVRRNSKWHRLPTAAKVVVP